jgi:hypothetical protein
MLCKGFLAAAGTKTPGQKIWFYSIRVPKSFKAILNSVVRCANAALQKVREYERITPLFVIQLQPQHIQRLVYGKGDVPLTVFA